MIEHKLRFGIFGIQEKRTKSFYMQDRESKKRGCVWMFTYLDIEASLLTLKCLFAGQPTSPYDSRPGDRSGTIDIFKGPSWNLLSWLIVHIKKEKVLTLLKQVWLLRLILLMKNLPHLPTPATTTSSSMTNSEILVESFYSVNYVNINYSVKISTVDSKYLLFL